MGCAEGPGPDPDRARHLFQLAVPGPGQQQGNRLLGAFRPGRALRIQARRQGHHLARQCRERAGQALLEFGGGLGRQRAGLDPGDATDPVAFGNLRLLRNDADKRHREGRIAVLIGHDRFPVEEGCMPVIT
ncbi:hypothetical protein EMIT051CA3_20287 [Pseudomonas chlororaphis]